MECNIEKETSDIGAIDGVINLIHKSIQYGNEKRVPALAKAVKDLAIARAVLKRTDQESRALAELISVRAAAERQEAFFPWNGRRGGGAPEPRHPISVPCPPKKQTQYEER